MKKKKKLEIILQSLTGFTKPKASLEQYPTPPTVASEILFFGYQMGDIEGKIIADLGSGPGIFSVGCCLLGAKEIHAVEIDRDAIFDLRRNIEKMGCTSIRVFEGDVREFDESVDTVFQNPPFGSQRKHADLPFLEKALEIGRVIYTLHNSETRDFLVSKIEDLGGKITHERVFEFEIPRIFKFHRKERVRRSFVFFRIENK